MTESELLAIITEYLRVTGENPTSFGKRVLGDPNFVGDLREGRSPSLRVVRKVMTAMDETVPL